MCYKPLVFAVLLSAVHALSELQTTRWPNSACDSIAGYRAVGVSTVKMADGSVERHCACLGDDAPQFSICPAAPGDEAVCDELFDGATGSYSAMCSVLKQPEITKREVTTVSMLGVDTCQLGETLGVSVSSTGQSSCECVLSSQPQHTSEFVRCESTCVQTMLGFDRTTAVCAAACEDTDDPTCVQVERNQGKPPSIKLVRRTDQSKRTHFDSRPLQRPSHTASHSHSHTYTSMPTGTSTKKDFARQIAQQPFCKETERICGSLEGRPRCVPFDEVTECGGCAGSSLVQDCTLIDGVSKTACLAQGCVVLSCRKGWRKVSDKKCELVVSIAREIV